MYNDTSVLKTMIRLHLKLGKNIINFYCNIFINDDSRIKADLATSRNENINSSIVNAMNNFVTVFTIGHEKMLE